MFGLEAMMYAGNESLVDRSNREHLLDLHFLPSLLCCVPPGRARGLHTILDGLSIFPSADACVLQQSG